MLLKTQLRRKTIQMSVINQSESSLFFSRPYLSNGQAIGTVVVRSIVCLSVTDLLWLNSAR